MSKTRLPCGCSYDERAWLTECDEHKAESDSLHARAMADYRAQEAGIVTKFKPGEAQAKESNPWD